MKLTLSWLRDHLETEAETDEIAYRLTMLGHEVESVEDRGEALAPFTVARVKEARQHPNADRLKLCVVETAEHGEVQVVCGAPNARTGMMGVFAPVGSYIPGLDTTLSAGTIRGVDSNGMLVSEREMGISDEHEGIIDLPEDTPLGAPFARIMGLDDPVFDIAITPNRADCLGVRGLARDLAAAGLGRLKPLSLVEPVPGGYESPMRWRRDLPAEAADACPYVAGRHFRGLRNAQSPEWMQRRLRAIGLRPISALVDITNYVTFDLGRPLHVYDADKVAGDLTMRLARSGESVLALDGATYELDEGMVVIADEAEVHGIGGVMGGERSGVDEGTTNVFLEVALFDPVRVARTGRTLGIHSDARFRFERGVDPQSGDWGVHVATRLIQEICGGETGEVVSAGAIPETDRTIRLRPARVEELGGVKVDGEDVAGILDRLGFAVREAGGAIEAAVPSWRADVEGEACLVEEVLRVHGYDAIPMVSLPQLSPIPNPAVSPEQRRSELARTALAWRGMDEAVTFSFMNGGRARLFGGVGEDMRLANPISSELDVMRPVILGNLVEACARNADRGYPDVALFEVGPQYRDPSPEGQDNVAAAVRAGRPHPRHWATAARPLDAFDAKADAVAALTALGAPVDRLQTSADAPEWYHPGRSGVLRLGATVLAHFGEIHPRVLEAYDLRGPAVGVEVFLDRVPLPKNKGGKAKPPLVLSPFQPVDRDFAFIVDEDVPAESLLRAARTAEKNLVAGVTLFDVYSGDKVGAGKKSLAITVTIQPTAKTLTDAEIEAVGEKIVAKVANDVGGTLRR